MTTPPSSSNLPALFTKDEDFFPDAKPASHTGGRSWKRDREAARLKAQGKSLYEVAELLHIRTEDGAPDTAAAATCVRNGLAVVHFATVEEKRTEQLHSLEMMKQHCWQQLDRPHVLVQQGRVIIQDGVALEDRRFVLEVMDRLCRIEETTMNLLGTKAVTRLSVEADQIGGEIIQLISMINETDTSLPSITNTLAPGAPDEGENA